MPLRPWSEAVDRGMRRLGTKRPLSRSRSLLSSDQLTQSSSDSESPDWQINMLWCYDVQRWSHNRPFVSTSPGWLWLQLSAPKQGITRYRTVGTMHWELPAPSSGFGESKPVNLCSLKCSIITKYLSVGFQNPRISCSFIEWCKTLFFP